MIAAAAVGTQYQIMIVLAATFALTFLIYTMYDAAKLLAVEIDSNTLSIAFLLATVSAGLGAWKLYKSK